MAARCITPQISLDGLTMREEGYTETGGGATVGADGFDLRVQPYYANSVRGYFGTTLRQDINFGGFFVQPEARVGYRYDFLADPVKLKAAFASLAGTSGSAFTLTGPDPERGTAVARRQPGGDDRRLVAGAQLRLSARQQRRRFADRHAHADRPDLGARKFHELRHVRFGRGEGGDQAHQRAPVRARRPIVEVRAGLAQSAHHRIGQMDKDLIAFDRMGERHALRRRKALAKFARQRIGARGVWRATARRSR